MLRLIGVCLLCILAAGAAVPAQKPKPPASPTPAQATAGDVTVTVSYTGKGVVNDQHRILVFLFDHPDVQQTSRPIGPPQLVIKNGSVATFKGVTQSPVYVVGVYDEKGGYDGTTGPPPLGTPWAVYGRTAKTPAMAIVPGPKGKITFRFDGSNRWK
jgi:hypothetical protein